MVKTTLLGATSALVPLFAVASANTAIHQPEGDQIVVTASPIAKSAEDVIAPVSVLAGDELAQQLRSNLGETLRREPGVSSTGFGAGAGRPIIRGLGGDRVRTLTNGLGSIDAAAASPDHATPIEATLAERIEIVRGPQLLRYGSSAAGGVINVLDGRIASETPDQRFNLQGRNAWTTVDDGEEDALAAQVLLGRVSGVDVILTASGAWREAGDYDIPGFAESARFRAMEEEEHEDDHDEEGHDHEEEEEVRGTLENSFVDVETYSGGLSFVGDRGFLGFSAQRYETQYGIAGHDHGHGHGDEEHAHEEEHGEEEEDGVFIDLEQTRFDINGSLEMGGFIERLNIFAGFADYQHTEFEAPGEPGTVFSNEGLEARFEMVQQQIGNWQGASGLQFRSREFSAIGEEAFTAPSESDQFGVFTFQEWTLGKATVEGALRFERTEHENTIEGISRSYDGISGSVGAAFRPADGVTLTASAFRTERAPTTEELFSNGPHLATQSFDIGNTGLGIETALGLEAGVRFRSDRFSASLTGFVTDYDDFVYQAATGETGADILIARGETDPEELEEFGELLALEYTAADAQFIGFEIEGRADLGQLGGIDLSTDVVVDYVQATLDDSDPQGNDRLPRIPPLGIIAGIDADAGRLGLRAEVEYSSEVDDVASFELPTDSFALFNLYAEYRIFDGLTFEVSGLNLTDEEARLHTSFLKDELPLPGRNVRFALRYVY